MNQVLSARPAWAEINLDSVAHNVRRIGDHIGPDTRIMAVVKADGYGHGSVKIAETALTAGATSLAVAFVEEAVALRRAGIEAPILILGYTAPEQFDALIRHKLTPTIFGLETAREFSRLALEHALILPLHLKVDTGMGRVGLLPDEAVEVASRVGRFPGLKIEGFYTHLAAAEEADKTYTGEQLLLFNRLIEKCRENGLFFPLVHAANSAAAISHPASRYNLVRLGLAMYGCYPAPEQQNSGLELLPALTLKSRVVLVKKVPAGTSISYGCTYRTEKETLVATVPIGYADGYPRLLSNKGSVIIRGNLAPVIGTICMDQIMVDVTDIPGARLNDEVILYGKQGAAQLSVEEAARLAGTINYEVLCSVDKRVPRYYFREGKLTAVSDLIGGNSVCHT